MKYKKEKKSNKSWLYIDQCPEPGQEQQLVTNCLCSASVSSLTFFSYASIFDVFMTNELLKNFCCFVLSSLLLDHILKLPPTKSQLLF